MFEQESIGNSTVLRIVDTRLITFIQQTAMQLSDPSLKRYPSFRFPGGLPVTIESHHVKTIRSNKYYFTAKADGFRVLLIFCMYYIEGNWERLCVTLQRDGSCHLISIEAPNDVNQNGGSIFDAEIVDLTSGWSCIMLFDCYSYGGENIRSLPLNRRFSRCETLAERIPQKPTDSIRIQAKPYFKLCKENIATLNAYLYNKNHYLDFNTDGVVIVPNGRSDVVHGKDETQFKLKALHTVDLIVISDDEEPGVFYLASYDNSDNSYVLKQEANMKSMENMETNQIIECSIVKRDGITSYFPIKIRYDKTHPNSDIVVERTLKTIEDNIQPDNLVVN